MNRVGSGDEGAPGLVMPADSSFSDADIASLGDYLRRTRTNLPRWTDLQEKVARIRRQLPTSHNRE